eukprot:4355467-Prymnesium_polylepis.1
MAASARAKEAGAGLKRAVPFTKRAAELVDEPREQQPLGRHRERHAAAAAAALGDPHLGAAPARRPFAHEDRLARAPLARQGRCLVRLRAAAAAAAHTCGRGRRRRRVPRARCAPHATRLARALRELTAAQVRCRVVRRPARVARHRPRCVVWLGRGGRGGSGRHRRTASTADRRCAAASAASSTATRLAAPPKSRRVEVRSRHNLLVGRGARGAAHLGDLVEESSELVADRRADRRLQLRVRRLALVLHARHAARRELTTARLLLRDSRHQLERHVHREEVGGRLAVGVGEARRRERRRRCRRRVARE